MLAIAVAVPMSAQDILAPTPPEPAVPPVLREQQQRAPASRPPVPPETPFKFGAIVLRPRLSYSYMNAEGLQATDGRRVASEIFTLAPGLSADLGDFWTLDYSPTWRNYTARAMMDSRDQSASLSGVLSYQDWGFQFSQNYAQSTPTLVQTGRQTKQETWVTSLSSSYSFNPGVQFQASAGMNEQYSDIAPDMRSWSSDMSINLAFSPRLSLNLGPSFTYNEVDQAPDLYDESYRARLDWRPTERLTVGFTTGMQYSHSTATAGINLSNPLLNFNLRYLPFETTSLSFSAARTIAPSYFGDEVTDTIRWSASLNQRLLGRFYLNLSYAPHKATYNAINSPAGSGREDSVKSYNAGLSTMLFGRLSVSATFAKMENESTVSGFNFSTKHYGVQLSYSY